MRHLLIDQPLPRFMRLINLDHESDIVELLFQD